MNGSEDYVLNLFILKEISGNHRSTNYARPCESTPSILEGWLRVISRQNVKVLEIRDASFPACKNPSPSTLHDRVSSAPEVCAICGSSEF